MNHTVSRIGEDSPTKEVIIRIKHPDNHFVELQVERCNRIGFKAELHMTEKFFFTVIPFGSDVLRIFPALVIFCCFSPLQSQERCQNLFLGISHPYFF